MKKRSDMQGEINRFNAALHNILAECKREKTEQADWPRTVGAVESIASEALGYNVLRIEGPFCFAGLTADGTPRFERADGQL